MTSDDREDWEDFDADEGPGMESPLPPRPRRRFLNGGTAALVALVTAAAGFLGGIELEKGQATTSSSPLAGRLSALATRFGGASAAGGTGARGPASGSGGFSGFGRGIGGGGGQVGTINSINGHTLYLTTTDGNTVSVKLSSATKIAKSESVGAKRIHPGDTVTVQGLTKSNGSIVATAVSDSGASGTSSASSSGSSTAASSGSGGVSSLFQPGGGG
jgi:hypothetical protein